MAKITNKTTALGAANATTDRLEIPQGDFSFILSGTFDGTVKVLRKQANINANMANGGTHTGSDAAVTLTDSKMSGIVADELIGMWITNDTTGAIGSITDNTTTTIVASLSSGTWSNGDVWSIWQEIESFTTPQKLIGSEPNNFAEWMAVMSTYSSGTARVLFTR